MKNQISPNFLNELFLLCFYKLDVVDIVNEHMQYEYIPKEIGAYKKILKSIKTIYVNTGKLPTFGVVSQQHQIDIKVQDVISEIKLTKLTDKEVAIAGLDEYIKLAKFEQLNKQIVELYNKGDHDAAIRLQAEESPKILAFSIKGTGKYFSQVFGEFEKRLHEKQVRKESGEHLKQKVPFGIYPLDIDTEGGIDKKDTVLWILRSGVGKSTAMRWTGMTACRLGFNVLHVQLEGSMEEVEDKYDQLWTACLYNQIRDGNIGHKQYEKLQKNLEWFKNHNRDIYIHAFEQFNSASMIDVRSLTEDFVRKIGNVDLIVIDYLKHLHPGDGIKYGADIQSVKMRKENTAEKMKNVSKEFETRIITADQATDIPMEIWNDPTKVMDRHNISGAKNLPDSFSYVLTGNQTRKENEENIMRIYYDKLRYYAPQDKVAKIVTAYKYGRFYNHKKTMDLYYNE